LFVIWILKFGFFMKFSCLSENLAQGLSIVSKAVSSKGSLPVLSHVLLQAADGKVKLAATDLETGIVTWIGAKIDEEGAVTVPARLLAELVNNLPPGKVEVSAEKQTLVLTAPRTDSRLSGLAAEEFPPLPEVAGKSVFLLDPKIFPTAVSQVVFAAAADESRPILTGVLVKGSGKNLSLVGVDGFRLAERKLDIDEDLAEDLSVVIPSRTLAEVARLSAHQEEPVKVTLLPEENQVLFELADSRITSRLLEGQFPDYEKIIPPSFNTRAQLATEEFLQAVRLASIFARDSASIVHLNLDAEKPLVLSATTAEVGEGKTEVEAKVEGEPLEIAFNSKYLTDVLSNLRSEEVIFEASGALNPGVIKPSPATNYLHLIMPVRTAS
jgi:DNA polymerase-3 subunit beta